MKYFYSWLLTLTLLSLPAVVLAEAGVNPDGGPIVETEAGVPDGGGGFDGGPPVGRDSGPADDDAGLPPARDAGATVDAGTTTPPAEEEDDCSVASSGSASVPSLGWLAVVGIVAFKLRRGRSKA